MADIIRFNADPPDSKPVTNVPFSYDISNSSLDVGGNYLVTPLDAIVNGESKIPETQSYKFLYWANWRTNYTDIFKYKYPGESTFYWNSTRLKPGCGTVYVYAIWKKKNSSGSYKPEISDLMVSRINNSGYYDPSGDKFRVSGFYEADNSGNYQQNISIKIEYKSSDSSTYIQDQIYSISSGFYGNFSIVSNVNDLDISKSYRLRVTIIDTYGVSTIYDNIEGVTSSFSFIDLKPPLNGNESSEPSINNTGIAFGKIAELNKYADFAYNLKTPHLDAIEIQPPNSTSDSKIGTSSIPYKNSYISEIYTSNIHAISSSDINFDSQVYFNNVIFTNAAFHAIGTLYADNGIWVNDGGLVVSSGETRLANTYISGNVTLHANNTYNLGSSSYQWNNIYGKNIYENGTALSSKYVNVSGDTMTGALTVNSTITSTGNMYCKGNYFYMTRGTTNTAVMMVENNNLYINASGYNSNNIPLYMRGSSCYIHSKGNVVIYPHTTSASAAYFYFTYSSEDSTHGGFLYDNSGASSSAHGYIGNSSHRWKGIYLVNNPNVSSDARLKVVTNRKLDDLSDVMLGVEPVEFKWKYGDKSGKTHIGFLAQDVIAECEDRNIDWHTASFIEESECDEDTKEKIDSDTYYSMVYTELIPVAIKMIQKQQAKIEELEARLNILESKGD